MKALEFPLSNNFFRVTKLDSTRDNTSDGRKGDFVTKGQRVLCRPLSNDDP